MGYIFESEIEMIMNSVRARTIGEAETIRLKDILGSDIHIAIKAYFKARVEQLLQTERQAEVRSKKFPYSLPEVVRLYEQVDLLLVHNYRFGQHDFEVMLDHAVHFLFNFLCRPQWTLLNFIFESQRRRPTSEIQRKLKYCVDYAYYGEIIKRYIEDRGLAELTYEEFSSLLEKIDHEIVATHSSIELALMTRPMVRFIEVALPTPATRLEDARIPINAAIVFFEDKKLNDIKERLEAERDRKNLTEITLLDLANVLERVRTGNAEAGVAFPLLQPESKETVAETEPQHDIEPSPVGGQHIEAAKPPVKIFSDFDDLEVTASEEKSSPAESAGGTSAGQTGASELSDMHSLFSLAEQKMFTKKIFKKDEVSFREALDELNRISDWKEAAKYIENIFVANDVDPFSEEAILFTDRVQSRYLPTDGGEPEE
jgi:hypothetical protein